MSPSPRSFVLCSTNLSMELLPGTNLMYLYALALPLVLWYNRKDVQDQIRRTIDKNLATSYNRVFDALRSQWEAQHIASNDRAKSMSTRSMLLYKASNERP